MSGIIQTYGIFWQRDDVYWRSTGANGQLLGVPARARSQKPSNFGQQSGIYVLYEGHEIVYVGQTGSQRQRLFARLKGHTRDALAGRWDHFSWFGLRRAIAAKRELSSDKLRATASVATVLNHMEAILLAAAEPALNKQGGRFGKDALRYLQRRDSRLGPRDNELLRELWKLTSKQ